jgi:hypothetical protein
MGGVADVNYGMYGLRFKNVPQNDGWADGQESEA